MLHFRKSMRSEQRERSSGYGQNKIAPRERLFHTLTRSRRNESAGVRFLKNTKLVEICIASLFFCDISKYKLGQSFRGWFVASQFLYKLNKMKMQKDIF
ncbi:MAG: hypothetical protein J6L64_04025 [Opitutales bacterium]|nr:hypothetical protein [Opitutales bacterium]